MSTERRALCMSAEIRGALHVCRQRGALDVCRQKGALHACREKGSLHVYSETNTLHACREKGPLHAYKRWEHSLPAGRTGGSVFLHASTVHGMHGQRSICRQAPPRLKTLSSTWRVMDGRVRGAFNHWASILHILHNMEDIGFPRKRLITDK